MDIETNKYINNVVTGIRGSGVNFYNPKVSTIGIDIPAKFTGVRIKMARTLNPNRTGQPKKGEKVYAREKTAIFTLTTDECCLLAQSFSAIKDGTYVNLDPKTTPERKDKFSVVHFPTSITGNKQPSVLIIEPSKNEQGKILGVKITIIPPKDTNIPSVHYYFRPIELIQFENFILQAAKTLDFYGALVDAFINTVKQSLYNANGDKGGNNGNNKNYNNPGYNQTPPPNEAVFSSPPDEAVFSSPVDNAGSQELFGSNDDLPF